MIGPTLKAADLSFSDIPLGQTFVIERAFTTEDVGCLHGIPVASLFSRLMGIGILGTLAPSFASER